LKWISARDLEQWSKVISARDALPAMVADLIRASAQDIASFRFPSWDKGQVRGFDGHLEAMGSPPFVPDGMSIWEFSVRSKADEEYDKHVKQISTTERANITFVFVTLQTWDNPKLKLQDWESGKRKRNEWKDIRYIDGFTLEHWLDEHPAVASRYARFELGLFPQLGARSADEFWHEYSNLFEPTLTEEVLLCERDNLTEDLLVQLGGQTSKIKIMADSPDEVIAFAVAAIRKADPQVRLYLEARTLIIDSEEAARPLATKRGLIFFPRGQARNISGPLAQSGPTLVAMGADEPKQNYQVLPRPSSGNLGKAIATMGFEEDRAYDLARKCGRSVTILRRLIPGGAPSNPEWTADGKMLLPALLAGGWDSQSVLDREVVSALAAGKTYFDYEADIRKFKRMQDSPLDQEQNIWKVRAPVDAFVYIGHLTGGDDLDRLKAAATAVFSHIEPMPDPIGELNARSVAIDNMFGYHLEHVFKSLEARDDVPKIDIARREYAYLPLLDHRDGSLTLHKLMAENAEFLRDVYRKATEQPEEPDEPTKENQNRARAGYQLLRSFKLVPGLGGDALDAAVLRVWIVEVRRRGAEEDRLVIAEQHIGHVLAHAQLLDPNDGAWPHRGVRGILEALDSEQIERGIVTERINMRGAHFKALYEGGEHERELAKQYRAWADTALAWSRTAALLENIAEWWERDGDAADVRARQDKMRE
jgi:hypothetical protein